MDEPKGARLYSSNQPLVYPVQGMQPYNATATNRRSTYKRFLCAFALGALVWYAGASFMRSVLHAIPWRGAYPIPPHVSLEKCVSYDEWSSLPLELPGSPFSAATTFDLPLSAESLLLLSRGPQSGGSVEIATSSEQDQDVVTVKVIVSYLREEARDEAKVCRILSDDGGLGVGIFTRRHKLFNRLHFATKITFPELSDKSPLLIKKFETDVQNTVHRVGDLNEKVVFQSLRLKGSNGPIDVQSLKVDQGTIKTSNGGISGVFNTSSLLILATSNGRVQTKVGLYSIDGSEPKLVITTSNGAIESSINSISDKGKGGSFDVTTRTSNGPLHIKFPEAPPDSILRLAGKTSNAGVSVYLNPAYEGSFLLQTSHTFKPQVKEDKSVVDPSGRNRKRAVDIKHLVGKSVAGEVFWDDDDDATEKEVSKPAGSVYLRTSNANIDLSL